MLGEAFNPSPAPSFRLSAGSRVPLKICDVTGGEVATLVDGTMSAGAPAVRLDER